MPKFLQRFLCCSYFGARFSGSAHFLALSLLILASPGCNRDAAQSSAPDISVLYFAGLPTGQFMREEIPAFTKSTGIRVKYQELPYDAVRQREVTSISSRLGSYDVIFVDDIWMYEYARKGYVIPLDPYIARDRFDIDDFSATARRAEAELDGKTWLIPQRADVQVLFYRQDLFDDLRHQRSFRARYGRPLVIPETWGDYGQVAVYFTTALGNTRPRVYGSGETLKRPHFAFEFFAMRYWSITGTQFFTDTREPAFATPQGAAALTELVKLKGVAAPGSANAAHDETIAAFARGELAMAPQWYAFYPTLRDPKGSTVGEKLGVALVPGTRLDDGTIRRTPSIGGGSLGIPVDAKNRDAAWLFIRHMTSKDFMARAALRGDIVPRKSAYLDPRLKQQNPAVPTYVASLEIAWFRPRLVRYAEAEAVIGRAVSRAFIGEAPPAEALASAAEEIKRSGLN